MATVRCFPGFQTLETHANCTVEYEGNLHREHSKRGLPRYKGPLYLDSSIVHMSAKPEVHGFLTGT